MTDIDPQEFGEVRQSVKNIEKNTDKLVVLVEKQDGRIDSLETFRDIHEAEKRGRKATWRTVGKTVGWIVTPGGIVMLFLHFVLNVRFF